MKIDKNYLLTVFKDPSHADREIWTKATKRSKKLQMHVLGTGLDTHFEKIDTYETAKQKVLRMKYSKSNRDMFARVLRARDYIWSAKGGGESYLTATDAQKDQLINLLGRVRSGYNLLAWERNFWMPRYVDDPMGVIFMEVDISRACPAYPTYKASSTIYAGKLDGRLLEYIVFRTADPAVFRVVDDALDQMVKWDGDKLQFLNSKSYPVFPTWFARCPGEVISDIPLDGQENAFASPIEDEVELADFVLREGSITNIHRFKFGFSRAWKYEEICGTCSGTKFKGADKCPDCNGSGKKLNSDPSDVMVLAWPDKEQPEIKEKGGYISPDIEYLKYADETMDRLEDLITYTHWGSEMSSEGNGETATFTWLNTQPVENRLSLYAMAAERMAEWITDRIAEYTFGDSYGGSTLNLGRRFLLESPDSIYTKYQTARKEGAPQSVLDDLIEDYYDTKLQGNDIERTYRKKLVQLEPGAHMTMMEANNNLPAFEYLKKYYFRRFARTKSMLQIAGSKIEELDTQLGEFALALANKLPELPHAAAPGTMDRNPAGGDPAPGAPGGDAGHGGNNPPKIPAPPKPAPIPG